MKFTDRLYGRIELPPLARDLAVSCPVLLRLREVRMANIPFASYPSFANVSRYEHSIGVAHLAWRFARSSQLAEDEALAVTIAALYHDGATPAFGHLYEELLATFGFNHEVALSELLIGTSELHGRDDAQVFLGRRCRLGTKLPLHDDESVLSRKGVASILAGGHPLSPIVVGSIDLDNIDNVVRASTAMGIGGPHVVHPYALLEALVWDADARVLRRRRNADAAVLGWRALRQELYDAILGNAFEFRAQTAIKWAIDDAARRDLDLERPAAWMLTEPELVHDRLRRHPFSRTLIDRVRLGSPPALLFSADVDDISPLALDGSADRVRTLCDELAELVGVPVFLNYYAAKGDRPIDLPYEEDRGAPVGEVGAQMSGVLGLIGWPGSAENYSRARYGPRRPQADELARAIAAHLGLSIVTASHGWTRRPTAQRQLPIFA